MRSFTRRELSPSAKSFLIPLHSRGMACYSEQTSGWYFKGLEIFRRIKETADNAPHSAQDRANLRGIKTNLADILGERELETTGLVGIRACKVGDIKRVKFDLVTRREKLVLTVDHAPRLGIDAYVGSFEKEEPDYTSPNKIERKEEDNRSRTRSSTTKTDANKPPAVKTIIAVMPERAENPKLDLDKALGIRKSNTQLIAAILVLVGIAGAAIADVVLNKNNKKTSNSSLVQPKQEPQR